MAVFLCSLIIAVCLFCVDGSDTPCTSQHGKCQEDNLACSGSYHSNLCSGHATRRCCIPSSSASTCANVNIIPRSQWGARAPKSTSYIHNPVHEFFIHHTDGHPCHSITSCSSTMRGIQNFHMNAPPSGRGWSDIGYSFLVGEDGNIYEGRGWGRVGAHTQGYNSKSYAASFMGTYTSHLPPQAAIQGIGDQLAGRIASAPSKNFDQSAHLPCPPEDDFLFLFYYIFYILFIQYFDRLTRSAQKAILPSGPL